MFTRIIYLFFRSLLITCLFMNFKFAISNASILSQDEYAVWNRMPWESRLDSLMKSYSNMTIFNEPRGNVVIGKINVGDYADRIGCVVISKPKNHSVILKKNMTAYLNNQSPDNEISIKAGEVIYLVTYTGEGTYLGLYKGKEIWWIDGWSINDIPNFSGKSNIKRDYVGVYGGSKDFNPEVWFYIRKLDGTTGWTKYANRNWRDYMYFKVLNGKRIILDEKSIVK